MRAMSSKLKEVAAVIAAILVNAFILSQLVGGIGANRPQSAFAQPYGAGETCDPTQPDQCVTGLICAGTPSGGGVCCQTACNGTTSTCNQPGSEGICTPVLTAPSLSWSGQFLAATLLTLLGWFGLKRARRSN
jgi:hypothetical protein